MKTQSLDALHRVVAARFADYQRKLEEARKKEWQRLQKEHPVFMQWAYYAFAVLERNLSQDAEEWIRIHKEVSREFGQPELLRPDHLSRLRDEITALVNHLCQALEDQIKRAADAEGIASPLSEAAQQNAVRGRVLNVIITSLEVLEAEGEAARVGKDPATSSQFALEPGTPQGTVTIRELAVETHAPASIESPEAILESERPVAPELSADQVEPEAINSPFNGVFSTKENRELAIERAAKHYNVGKTDLAKRMKVDYRDLRAWARDRGSKFAKGESSKTKNIEEYLLPFAPDMGARVGARANTPQKNA